MQNPKNPLLELAVSLTCVVVPIVIGKVKDVRKEKKRLKDGNIIVLKPEIRS